MSTVTPQQTAPQPAALHPSAAAPEPRPAVIATRQRCDADGVGLSHYILMDRKPAR